MCALLSPGCAIIPIIDTLGRMSMGTGDRSLSPGVSPVIAYTARNRRLERAAAALGVP